MADDQIPSWAVELTRVVTILNERLPTHVEWTERNIKDHEMRLRSNEEAWHKLATAMSRLDDVEKRVRETEKKLWMAYGGLAVLVSAIELIRALAG
jgi:hypothetical protein